MKKIYLITLLVASFALAFSNCKKDDPVDKNNGGHHQVDPNDSNNGDNNGSDNNNGDNNNNNGDNNGGDDDGQNTNNSDSFWTVNGEKIKSEAVLFVDTTLSGLPEVGNLKLSAMMAMTENPDENSVFVLFPNKPISAKSYNPVSLPKVTKLAENEVLIVINHGGNSYMSYDGMTETVSVEIIKGKIEVTIPPMTLKTFDDQNSISIEAVLTESI